ncbi:MAG: 16S rRNA (guanine(966)-N(2))-methyltransferase RsmD [Actinomycetales bacterium]|nr:16S rRNA (guanine(966)-N(2))-methyltransferase RsmD [Actinomycetales bacterium]
MRIVAGAARGRRLAPPAAGTRPTSDRVREALLSAIESRLGALGGLRVVDLYAGSGAVGLEALSRGASHVLLVERDRRALDVVRANVAAVGLPHAVVLAGDVGNVTSHPPPATAVPPYDVAFLDPPYDVVDDVLERVLTGLADHGWLGAGSLVVVERARRGSGFAWPPGYTPLRDRDYGDTRVRTALWYGRDA